MKKIPLLHKQIHTHKANCHHETFSSGMDKEAATTGRVFVLAFFIQTQVVCKNIGTHQPIPSLPFFNQQTIAIERSSILSLLRLSFSFQLEGRFHIHIHVCVCVERERVKEVRVFL